MIASELETQVVANLHLSESEFRRQLTPGQSLTGKVFSRSVTASLGTVGFPSTVRRYTYLSNWVMLMAELRATGQLKVDPSAVKSRSHRISTTFAGCIRSDIDLQLPGALGHTNLRSTVRDLKPFRNRAIHAV
jgi:hypothetical protein